MGLTRDPSGLHRRRIEAVLEELRARDVRSVLDLGCGDGDLLVEVAQLRGIERLWGFDVDAPAIARARARMEELPPTLPGSMRIEVRSLTERPEELRGFDAAVLLEVIEHVDASQLGALESAIFSEMRPSTVILTTPNSEYNPLLGVPESRFRHPDHRFEWNREQFADWALRVAARYGYRARFRQVPEGHPRLGGPSQMAVFTLADSA